MQAVPVSVSVHLDYIICNHVLTGIEPPCPTGSAALQDVLLICFNLLRLSACTAQK